MTMYLCKHWIVDNETNCGKVTKKGDSQLHFGDNKGTLSANYFPFSREIIWQFTARCGLTSRWGDNFCDNDFVKLWYLWQINYFARNNSDLREHVMMTKYTYRVIYNNRPEVKCLILLQHLESYSDFLSSAAHQIWSI